MREWQSQSHVRWYCRYHLVFVPKYRKRSIYGVLRRNVGVCCASCASSRGSDW